MSSTNETPSLRTQFTVDTEVYSGPLDLLISLIEKRKLLVNDISLADVTDDYMRYVALMEKRQLEDLSHFLVLASTLLLIKSKSLLPVLDLSSEEEASIEQLEERLRLYQIYRTAAVQVEAQFGTRLCYGRQFTPLHEPLFLPDRYSELSALSEALKEVITRLPKKEEKPKVQVRTVISLEETMLRLESRIEQQFSCWFREFTDDTNERSSVIVGFLAVLEMVKQGVVIVRQQQHFADIEIERERARVPRYR